MLISCLFPVIVILVNILDKGKDDYDILLLDVEMGKRLLRHQQKNRSILVLPYLIKLPLKQMDCKIRLPGGSFDVFRNQCNAY